MSNIPLARDLILMHAMTVEARGDATTARLLRTVVKRHMTRKSPVRRAPVKSKPVTKTMAWMIRVYAEEKPKASLQHIAEAFGVNIGRVSEVLTGKR